MDSGRIMPLSLGHRMYDILIEQWVCLFPSLFRAKDVMDVYVLLNAITKCMSSEEKELCRIGELALNMMIETAAIIVGDRGKAADLPIFEVMADKLCSLCYERAWFAKSGGYVCVCVCMYVCVCVSMIV